MISKAVIKSVYEGSIAEEAGFEAGDAILKINKQEFKDILEYKFLTSDAEIELEILKKDGTIEVIEIETDYEDLGIEFEKALIDSAKSCQNKCIFCFIDQLPKGMRETVYFKDDDTRLSFLQGNYVTLTNMTQDEIDSIIKMRVSPINISVHTTNGELRKKMLNNKNADKLFDIMKQFRDNNIYMNCQIVLCPNINDKDELDNTIGDLVELYPYVNSLSVVPVGLTRYRQDLYEIKPFTSSECYDVVMQISEWQKECKEHFGLNFVYLADEFYLKAKLDLPKAEHYDDFPQIENGVGLLSSMADEFENALSNISSKKLKRHIAIATGMLAYNFIRGLADKLQDKFDGLIIDVYSIRNNFFGENVTVTGLVTGGDIIEQLKGKPFPEFLIISQSMLRADDVVFLDDTTISDIEEAIGVSVIVSTNDGYDFVEKCTTIKV